MGTKRSFFVCANALLTKTLSTLLVGCGSLAVTGVALSQYSDLPTDYYSQNQRVQLDSHQFQSTPTPAVRQSTNQSNPLQLSTYPADTRSQIRRIPRNDTSAQTLSFNDDWQLDLGVDDDRSADNRQSRLVQYSQGPSNGTQFRQPTNQQPSAYVNRNAAYPARRQDDPFGEGQLEAVPPDKNQEFDPFADPPTDDGPVKNPPQRSIQELPDPFGDPQVEPQPRQPQPGEVQPREVQPRQPQPRQPAPRQSAPQNEPTPSPREPRSLEYPPGSVRPGDVPQTQSQPRQPATREPVVQPQPFMEPQPNNNYSPPAYAPPYPLQNDMQYAAPSYPTPAANYPPQQQFYDQSYAQPYSQPYAQPYAQPYSPQPMVGYGSGYDDAANCDQCGTPAGCQDCGFDCGTPNFYFSIFAGTVELDEMVSSNGGTILTDDGAGFGIGIGQRHGYNLRSELEFGYRTNDISGLQNNVLTQSVTGDIKSYSGMANAYWEFMNFPHECFKPYVGAGIGFASIDTNMFGPNGQSLLPSSNENDTSLAYQFMAGVNYKAYRNMDLFLEYRLFEVDTFRIDALPGLGDGKYDYQTNNIFAGLRYKF